MSYAGVARRTTRRAYGVGAVGIYGAPVYGAPVDMARPLMRQAATKWPARMVGSSRGAR